MLEEITYDRRRFLGTAMVTPRQRLPSAVYGRGRVCATRYCASSIR